MEEAVHDITIKMRQRKKSMTWTSTDIVQGSFNLTKPGNNTMHTFLNNNISEFGGNLEGMQDEGNYRSTVRNMHKFGWKAQYFKSADVSMLVHGCGVSQYPQFYDTKTKYQMLPRPYVGSYSGEKGHQILQQPRIIALAKSIETFIEVSMIEMQTIKYWQNLGRRMEEEKLMIPKEYRIGDTCFMSLANIGGNLYTIHPKNLNHAHKDSKDLLLVIIILGTDVNCDETGFFMMEIIWMTLEKDYMY